MLEFFIGLGIILLAFVIFIGVLGLLIKYNAFFMIASFIGLIFFLSFCIGSQILYGEIAIWMTIGLLSSASILLFSAFASQ